MDLQDHNPYKPGEVALQRSSSGPIEFPGQQIKLSFVCDLKHLMEAIKRYRTRKTSFGAKPFFFIARWYFALVCISFALYSFATKGFNELVQPLVYLSIGLAIIFMRSIEKVFLRRWFSSSPHLNKKYSITLTDEGYFTQSPLHYSKLLWSTFTEAIEFPTGVLLLEGNHRYHWLPFASLEDKDQSSILCRYIASRIGPQDQASPEAVASKSAALADSTLSRTPVDQIKVPIVYDAKYLVESLTRLRQAHRTSSRTVIKYLIAVALTCHGIWMISIDSLVFAIGSLLIAGVIVFRDQIENFRLVRYLKSSPHNNEHLAITLSDDGVHVQSALQDVELDWNSFTKVVKFADGVLLCRGKLQANWLPYRCLENQLDAARLYELVAAKFIESRTPDANQRPQGSQAI